MIKTAALIFVVAALAFAQTSRNETAPLLRTGADSSSIPAAAIAIETNLYRYTDASGKTWLYSRTPFGLSRREEQPAAQPATSNAPPVSVSDLGDSVRFEVQTPFGISRWVSKKADLTDGEQLMLLRQQLKNQCAVEKTVPAAVQETK